MAISQRLDNFSNQPKKAKIGGNIKVHAAFKIESNFHDLNKLLFLSHHI